MTPNHAEPARSDATCIVYTEDEEHVMTPQEQDMIDGLIGRIRSTPVANKDTAAEQRLQQGLAGSPDALYVLAQTVLVQQYGLGQAKAQIQTLQQQLDDVQQQAQQQAAQPKASGGSFLSHIFGGGASQPPAPSQPPPYQAVNNPGYGTQPYPGGYPPPPPNYPPQGYPAPTPSGFGGGGFGGGGFLQGALQTAAGVAAGEMAFQGMESLFHGFEHGGGGGGFDRSFAGGSPGESVVNNYYDDNGDRGRADSGHDDSGFYNPEHDASRGDSGGDRFADTNDPGNAQDLSGNDDLSSNDDSSFADSSDDFTSDDSGSDNFGGGDNSGF